jgi:hypothetical protein
VTICLLLVRLVIVMVAVRSATTASPTEDVARFQEIRATEGVPYRDFAVEYAPLEVLFVRVFASVDGATTTARLAVLAFLADLATWLAVGFGWGSTTARRYLWLGTPLLVFAYTRFDLVAVAVAAWGAALAVRRHERAGGLTMAAAILTKLWPATLVPGLLVSGRKCAFVWCVGATGLLVAAWVAIGGVRGISDVVTFRHAAGWEVESTIGTIVWIATGGPIRMEAGAPRIGTVPPLASVVLAVSLVGMLAAVWITAARRERAAFGAASVAAIASLVALSPTFSLQYAAWFLPWGAIAMSDGDRWHFWGVAAVSVLSAVLFVVYGPERAALGQSLLMCRNALVVALPILWLLRDGQSVATDNAAANSAGSVTGSRQTNR